MMIFGRGHRSAVPALIDDPEPVRFDMHRRLLREVQEQEAARQLPIPVAPPGFTSMDPPAFSYSDAVNLLYADVARYGETS